MAEEMSGPVPTCPWCSAPLPDPATDHCPNCDATISGTASESGDIKGVTTLDTEAILRARSEVARPRNRILSFITGEVGGDDTSPASPESLAPPPDEVRREMLRLQLEAERAELTAETVALKSAELAKIGIPLSQLGVDESALVSGETLTPGGEAPAPDVEPTSQEDETADLEGLPVPVAAAMPPPPPSPAASPANAEPAGEEPPPPA